MLHRDYYFSEGEGTSDAVLHHGEHIDDHMQDDLKEDFIPTCRVCEDGIKNSYSVYS